MVKINEIAYRNRKPYFIYALKFTGCCCCCGTATSATTAVVQYVCIVVHTTKKATADNTSELQTNGNKADQTTKWKQ